MVSQNQGVALLSVHKVDAFQHMSHPLSYRSEEVIDMFLRHCVM